MRVVLSLTAVTLCFTGAPAWAAESRDPAEIRKRNALDCTFRLTNDYVQDVIMMQDTTFSSDACQSSCAAYAKEYIVSMRDAVYVLSYTCEYRGQIVANVNLK